MSSGSDSRCSAEGYWRTESFVVNLNRVIVQVSEIPDVEDLTSLKRKVWKDDEVHGIFDKVGLTSLILAH